MTTDYNVRVELDTRNDIDELLVDRLAAYHPATGRTARGRVEVILTVPAADLVQLMQTTVAVLAKSVDAPVLAVEVMTTDEFDRRLGQEPMPALVSVTEASARLGVSRQAVQQRLDAGTLPGQKVGNTWVVQASAVESAFERAMRQATNAGQAVTDEAAKL